MYITSLYRCFYLFQLKKTVSLLGARIKDSYFFQYISMTTIYNQKKGIHSKRNEPTQLQNNRPYFIEIMESAITLASSYQLKWFSNICHNSLFLDIVPSCFSLLCDDALNVKKYLCKLNSLCVYTWSV